MHSEMPFPEASDISSRGERPEASLAVQLTVTVSVVRPSMAKGANEKLPIGFPDLYAVPSRTYTSMSFAGLSTMTSRTASAESNPFIAKDLILKD